MKRELQEDDIVKVHDRVLKVALRTMAEHNEEIAPHLLAVWIDDAGAVNNMIPVPPELMQTMMKNAAGKELLMMVVREAFKEKLAPDVMVMVSEAWSLEIAGPDAKQKADSYRTGTLEHEPGRGESLIVSVYTPTRSYMGMHRIETDSAGKRTVVVRPLDMDGVLSGRLTIEGDEVEKEPVASGVSP